MRIHELILSVTAFFVFLLSMQAMAKQSMVVNTGFGYLSYNAHIIADYNFKPGTYEVCDNMQQTEVASASDLNSQIVNSDAYMAFFQNPGCH